MNTLVLPIASLLLAILITIIFFGKERINNEETKIYSRLLILNLIDAILAIVTFVFAKTINIKIGIAFLQKIYMSLMILMTVYINQYNISIMKIKNETKKILNKLLKISFFIIFAIILMSPLNVINNGDILDGYGLSHDITLCAIIIYLILMMFSSAFIFKTNKENFKKDIPFICLILLYIIGIGARYFFPNIIFENFFFSYVLFIMYFTMENPDIKMIEQLEVAREQADKANRAKTDFLSSMSHEIRTPLNAIVGFSDYIMTSKSLDEAKENAKDIVNASNTLLEIVNSILDISKIEAGKLEIVNSKYNAKNTFEGLAKLITPKMNEKGLDFSYYIAPDVPETLFGDPANIKKVITNLLSNAYKYTEKGFVRYEVNCINNPGITKLIITVEDSGRGIKQDKVDKLFTKFQRLEEDKNTTIEGTGLGLAITKQLTELMGGRILVHTVYGQGSKFTIILDQKVSSTPVKEEQKEIKTTLDLLDKKILIVDDNELNLKVATKVLQRFNANAITTIDNGFDCIEKIKSGEKYDIILLDDMMPKMSGIETLNELKALPNFNIPVVALTANAIAGMKEKYIKEGFNEYLAKPLEKDELIRVMNELLSTEEKQEEDTEIL